MANARSKPSLGNITPTRYLDNPHIPFGTRRRSAPESVESHPFTYELRGVHEHYETKPVLRSTASFAEEWKPPINALCLRWRLWTVLIEQHLFNHIQAGAPEPEEWVDSLPADPADFVDPNVPFHKGQPEERTQEYRSLENQFDDLVKDGWLHLGTPRISSCGIITYMFVDSPSWSEEGEMGNEDDWEDGSDDSSQPLALRLAVYRTLPLSVINENEDSEGYGPQTPLLTDESEDSDCYSIQVSTEPGSSSQVDCDSSQSFYSALASPCSKET